MIMLPLLLFQKAAEHCLAEHHCLYIFHGHLSTYQKLTAEPFGGLTQSDIMNRNCVAPKYRSFLWLYAQIK